MLKTHETKRRTLTVVDTPSWYAARPTILPLLAICSMLICYQLPARAQSASTGAVSGSVLDPSNAVVAGATITVTNKATGEKRTVNSGPAGSYLLPFLPPGNYTLVASAKSFKRVSYPDVHVDVTETVKLDIRLTLGAVDQVVTVESQG